MHTAELKKISADMEGRADGIYELTVLLHKEQAKLIREAMKAVGETKGVGHAQKAGNAIYEIIRQWTEIEK